ncbi:transcription-repair coupling factor [Candidatus Peregrinibacteria bacterium]|nr:transcription-repair coupling factor [Candidatus Peregrinibacteria bacterium]
MSEESFQKNHILLSSFFLGDFLGESGIKIFQENKKLTVSGVPNISSKLFLFENLLKSHPKTRNILFVTDGKNDLHETASLAPYFLSGNGKYIDFSTLSFSEERGQEKSEWVLKALQKDEEERIHVFFCTKEDALEFFPNPKTMEEEKVILKEGQKISAMQIFNRLIKMGYSLTSDIFLQKGEYRRSGNVLDIFPLGFDRPVKVEVSFDEIESIFEFFPESKKIGKHFGEVAFYPISHSFEKTIFSEVFSPEDIQIFNELEELSENAYTKLSSSSPKILEFSSFPEDEKTSIHLRFLSVLKYFNLSDLLADFREKVTSEWKIVIMTKRKDELKNILLEEFIPFQENGNPEKGILLIDAGELESVPPSFQNQEHKICLFTDREIFHLHGKKAKKIQTSSINIDFLTSLKVGDLVVHLDHGIGRFLGICEQEISGITREYLEISYLQDDKLYVPVDQADKISRYISDTNEEPKLTRLGGVEWKNIQKKVRAETEKIAKELLQIYAARAQVKGDKFNADNEKQGLFEGEFPYEETPGQIAAIRDIKADLENDLPMDRLLCGDVGFGKTEVAMRAAFKVVQSGKQVAMIAPITILVHQHFDSFQQRMEKHGVKIEVLSRFKTKSEQKQILRELEKGKIDIVLGTHRLLGEDVRFYNLGLVIIDEEQRFGVKQKEKFKKLRSEVSILTLTATPIPRTLNLALHKLRDISTITTPPPGRLPIITEVRKYSDALIREAILKETARGGQVYFLHNRVETIEAMAYKLQKLIPEASFVVAHGQMVSAMLEDRIFDFKEKKYNVLVSSTIIENGIDLPNANTLIVNNAEQFGLSQLYQLRGRIGRSKIQAYAYLLHSSQKLSLSAKKRLKALIEASELGSGFQLSMRDLEIRGAGDVLGVNQHGTVNVVGVSHFLRLLNQTIRELQEGEILGGKEIEEAEDVLIEIAIDAYIPGTYVVDSKEKILLYQKLASVKNLGTLRELQEEISEEYGRIPKEVMNLFKVLEVKILAREANVRAVKMVSVTKNDREIHLVLSKKVTAVEIMNLLKYQQKWKISGETLKTPVKEMGFDWMRGVKEALQKLVPKSKKIIHEIESEEEVFKEIGKFKDYKHHP